MYNLLAFILQHFSSKIYFKKSFKKALNVLVHSPYPYTISSSKDNEAARRMLRRRI
jgi:hypothetical protein